MQLLYNSLQQDCSTALLVSKNKGCKSFGRAFDFLLHHYMCLRGKMAAFNCESSLCMGTLYDSLLILF